MPLVVFTAPGGTQGENLPVGVQFGNKYFICYPDLRPLYLLNSMTGNNIKAYLSGIKPSIAPPFVQASSEAAVNITYDSDSGSPDANNLFIRYAYYSSVRGVFSEVSPETVYAIPNVAQADQKKVTIGGFYYPRDDAVAQDIDTIVVGVQWGVSNDCMCIWGLMSTGFDPTNLTSASITFDSSMADLNQLGFGLLTLSQFVGIPPACASVERVQERLYYVPSRRRVDFNSGAVQVIKAQLTGTSAFNEFTADMTGTNTLYLTELQNGDYVSVPTGPGTTKTVQVGTVIDDTNVILNAAYGATNVSGAVCTRLFRGEPAARVILSTTTWEDVFNDSLYHMRFTVNGQLLGEVWDVLDYTHLYLDGDVPANIDATTDFFFYAPGDAVLPSGYTNETPFAFPLSIPEGIQFIDQVSIEQAVDEGEIVQGIKRGGEFAYVELSETVLQMTVASGSFSPLAISFRPIAGNIGPISQRSICLDQTASISWIGQEGIASANTAGAATLSNSINCLRFWKGGRWVDEESLVNCSMEFSRGDYGYVLAGLKVNSKQLTGAFTLTQGSGAVVATGGALLTQAAVGDVITDNQQSRTILSITDDNHMTIETWTNPTTTVGLSIGEGYWALISMQPQVSIMLFNGLICTSNLLAYQDANGQTVILGGSNYKGRVFRVLTPGVYVDVPLGSDDDPAAYTCSWREGWQAFPDGSQSSIMRARMMGVSAPDPTGIMTLSVWTSDLPQMNEADLPTTAFLSKTVAASKVLFDVPLPPNCKRFGSLAVEFQSTAGLVATRPMEITRWRIMGTGDGK